MKSNRFVLKITLARIGLVCFVYFFFIVIKEEKNLTWKIQFKAKKKNNGNRRVFINHKRKSTFLHIYNALVNSILIKSNRKCLLQCLQVM
jgi:hypothetical protein